MLNLSFIQLIAIGLETIDGKWLLSYNSLHLIICYSFASIAKFFLFFFFSFYNIGFVCLNHNTNNTIHVIFIALSSWSMFSVKQFSVNIPSVTNTMNFFIMCRKERNHFPMNNIIHATALKFDLVVVLFTTSGKINFFNTTWRILPHNSIWEDTINKYTHTLNINIIKKCASLSLAYKAMYINQ